jgi:hypothetical protein
LFQDKIISGGDDESANQSYRLFGDNLHPPLAAPVSQAA